MAGTTCTCDCHTGPYAACSTPGGCGTTGCTRDTPGTCPACYRRDAEHGLVCEPCRNWLPAALYSIDEKYRRLPDVLVPSGTTTDAKVAGSREPAAPLNLDAEDLLTRVVRNGGIPYDSTPDTLIPAHELQPTKVNVSRFEVAYRRETDEAGAVTLHTDFEHTRQPALLNQRRILTHLDGAPVLQPAGDQIGYLPVAQVLDVWVRDWIDTRQMREHRPVPTVTALIDWLGNRLDWACNHSPAIGDFADAIRSLRGDLMSVLGEYDPPEQPCDGVQCARCDRRQLFHAQDGSGDIVCRNENCRKVYRADDYHALVKEQADQERACRTPAEIAERLRSREPALQF